MAKILLVDKDETFTNACKTFFQGCGYSIECTAGIETAQSKIETSPDVLILSLDLGSSAVSSLLPAIKNQVKPPFIIIYSYRKNPGPEFGQIMGLPQIRGFLVKPFPIYRLGELVVQIFPMEQGDESDATFTAIPQEQIQFWLGKNLSGCTLESCLSYGNFSLVYKGTYLEKPVVVKILANLGMQQKERLVRFQREVEVLSKFKHPNIIEVLTTGQTQEGIYYMVMPFFEGENLDQILIREQKLPLAVASNIVYQVAQGMAAIHTTQVIHRDLKPANILYNRIQNLAKVIDFGLVRDVSMNHAITRRGYILGTPYYMSPEQCEGRFLDVRTDIYSLGITFYQLLTGLVPFDKSSPIKTLLAHIREPLTWPDEITQEVPLEIRNLIEKMTAKKASERYQSMLDVAKMLGGIHRQFSWNF